MKRVRLTMKIGKADPFSVAAGFAADFDIDGWRAELFTFGAWSDTIKG